jgi:lysophospholipase L1-like esterase
VTFVGTVQSGTMQNNQNEGHSGWVISQIASAAQNDQSFAPDVVLLHAGTNDCNNPSLAPTAYQRLASLIDQLVQQFPKATILVAEIIPSTNSQTNQAITNFDSQIPGG